MEAKPAYQNFEEAFDQLLEKAKTEPVSMHTLLNTLSGKGKILLLIHWNKYEYNFFIVFSMVI